MAQATPVNGWDMLLLAAAESAFGTPPTPASTSAYAALALSCINADLGPPEQGVVRPYRDRATGRASTRGFVEGRVAPIPFTVEASIKGRSAIDVAAQESVLYKAAGLKQTLNGSTNAQYTLSSTPIEASEYVSATLTRFLGSGAGSTGATSAQFESEVLRGCVVESLRWEGGDKEVTLRASGKGIGKYSRGALESITLASGVGTTLTHTAEESYRLAPGYYICESEIILIAAASDIGYGSTSTTIARAQLGTSGAAHSTKPLYPYRPTPTWTGAPIPETTCTVSIGGVTFRAMSWFVELATGLSHLPGETGSAYVQGVKSTRYSVRYGVRLVLTGDGVSLLGKVTKRATAGALAVSIAQGTGTGSIMTFASTYTELEPFALPATVNDVTIVDVALRVRENSGNDAFTLTLT